MNMKRCTADVAVRTLDGVGRNFGINQHVDADETVDVHYAGGVQQVTLGALLGRHLSALDEVAAAPSPVFAHDNHDGDED